MDEDLSYEELLQRYNAIKKYLFIKDIHLPLSIEPYTKKEYDLRNHLPKLYWGPRDYEAILWEQSGKATWL